MRHVPVKINDLHLGLHAQDRVRQYRYDRYELAEIIGTTPWRQDRARHDLEPGAPVRIGWQAGSNGSGDRKDIYLGVSTGGRRAIFVVAYCTRGEDRIVTLWDPDDIDNAPLWDHTGRTPTRRGAMSMPPTCWRYAPGRPR